MVDGDKVIELDVIAKEAFGKPIRLLPTKNRLDCLRIRNDKLALLMRKQHTMPIGSTWLIATEPLAETRQWWADTVKPQSIIIIATPFDECMRRASLDEEKAKRRGQGVGISIADWWKAYKPRHDETVIRP